MAALFIFSGIGLAILITPRVFEKYSLYFSPFVGLAYLSYCSWFLFEYSSMGTNQYAKFLLIPPLFFLVIAAIFKKDRIASIVFPCKKENLIIILICWILFVSIAYPYYSKIDGISNTITRGNNDIVDYASTSKYLMTSSFTHPTILSPLAYSHPSRYTRTPSHVSVGFTKILFFGIFIHGDTRFDLPLESYQLQNLILYLFFVAMVPSSILFRLRFSVIQKIWHFLLPCSSALISICYIWSTMDSLGRLSAWGFFSACF